MKRLSEHLVLVRSYLKIAGLTLGFLYRYHYRGRCPIAESKKVAVSSVDIHFELYAKWPRHHCLSHGRRP